jgi:hypothetical protein
MRTLLAGLALLLVVNGAALAQTPTPINCQHSGVRSAPPNAAVLAARRNERQACATDMAKFCANVPRGCGRPMQCLRAHAAAVSGACAGAMTALRSAHAQARSNPPASAR